MSLALPATHTGRWLELFLGGLRRASRRFQCLLAGGDTTRRDQILINITVIGEVPTGQAILRSGARPGDILYVSGRLGEAELGLQIVRRSTRLPRIQSQLMKKHLYPEPRLALGLWLSKKRLATAMLDLSDGLSSDLPRLCAASSVGATVEMERIPQVRVPPYLLRKKGLIPSQFALNGGDDYELLFSVPAHKAKLLPHTYHGVALSAIGKITSERNLLVMDAHGRKSEFKPRGWDPFRKRR
jgi:thiamine-monophosphate kinase